LDAAVQSLHKAASPEELVATLRACFSQALTAVDTQTHGDSEGSTLSALILQLETMICATLQLGDCEIYAANAETGEFLAADVLLHIDDGESEGTKVPAMAKCATRTHGFGDDLEIARYNRELVPHGMDMYKTPRTDQMKGEDRYWGKVNGSRVEFNECARAVESLKMYPPDIMQDSMYMMQRRAEYLVWQLPRNDDPVALIICCDGFASKKALPAPESTVRLVCDPEAYMCDVSCLDGTIFRRFGTKAKHGYPATSPAWSEDAVEACYMTLSKVAPDRDWREAVETSYQQINTLRSNSGGRVPRLLENPQAATNMAANVPVLMMSDDNVTLNVLLITAVEA